MGCWASEMAVKVKICGITNLPDGMAAAEAGADALGFMFYDQSPRNISVEAASGLASQLPQFVLRVGVFVNAPEDLVIRAIRECGLNLLQFHGDESPEYCLQFGLMSMKAFRVRDAASLQAVLNYHTDAWLLDAYSPEKPGGTGETFNWDLALEAQAWGRPIFLAGGLDSRERRRGGAARTTLWRGCLYWGRGRPRQEGPRQSQGVHTGGERSRRLSHKARAFAGV